jgi:hypothetical protein
MSRPAPERLTDILAAIDRTLSYRPPGWMTLTRPWLPWPTTPCCATSQ